MTPAPLPERPSVAAAWRGRLERVIAATRREPRADLAAIVRQELGVDLCARYGGLRVPHPFGKASGQLSCTLPQVEADIAAGVAFVVLKTVIAENAAGDRAMEEWASAETRMKVESIESARGITGWTVTWQGRGWAGTLEDYADFFGRALETAREGDVPVIPSVKFHLPGDMDEAFRSDEYVHTVGRLLAVWKRHGCGGPMVLEKDLSPTLAGDARAAKRETILRWLRAVPGLVHAAAPGRTSLGMKLMNALFDDAFQVEMVRVSSEEADPRPAFLVAFNRLFDPGRRVAFGGYDLSDRNLRVLDDLCPPVSLSATGNICSGRMMLEYARRGCENGQVHTFFQVPLEAYTATHGGRSARALHTLLLHPEEGLVVWLRHLRDAGQLDERDGAVHFLDLVDTARAA